MEVDDVQSLSCELCDVKFRSEKAKSYHEASKSKSNQKIARCKHCDFLSCTARGISMHIRSDHPDLLDYYCKQCPLRFYLKKELKAHLKRKHSKVPKFEKFDFRKDKCSKCDIVYKDSKRRRVHENAAAKVFEILQCDHCDFKSCTQKGLEYHARKYHLETFRFGCSNCGKLFEKEESLSYHKANRSKECLAYMKVIKPIKPIKPSILKIKAFPKVKISIDQYEKFNLSCDHCDARFRDGAILAKHKRNTPKNGNFWFCSYCPRKFCTKRGWKYHLNMYHPSVSNIRPAPGPPPGVSPLDPTGPLVIK